MVGVDFCKEISLYEPFAACKVLWMGRIILRWTSMMGCYIHSFNVRIFHIYSCRGKNHRSSLHNRVGQRNYYNENKWSCPFKKLFFVCFYLIKMILVMSSIICDVITLCLFVHLFVFFFYWCVQRRRWS